MGVAVGGNGSDLSDLSAGGDIALVALEVFDDGLGSGLDTASQVHGVASSGDVLDGLGEDGAGEDSSGSSTVTSDFVGLAGNILEKAGTKVLELVLEDNGLGDGDTIWNTY